jgi:CheY-like chemotaxis protein
MERAVHSEPDASRPVILLVDPDPALRRLLRLGLELDGARVLESGSVEQAIELLADPLAAAQIAGVIVACDLPDAPGGEAVDRLRRFLPGNPPILTAVDMAADGDGDGNGNGSPPSPHVVRGDVQAVLDALHLPTDVPERRRLVAVDVLSEEADVLAQRWRELCRWDPLLPPDASPPVAGAVVRAVAAALGRPQPLGWGPDPDVEKVAEVFATGVGGVESAVGELVCLREVLRRRLTGALPADEETETWARLYMIVDRAMGVAVARIASRLEQQAYVDSLTADQIREDPFTRRG